MVNCPKRQSACQNSKMRFILTKSMVILLEIFLIFSISTRFRIRKQTKKPKRQTKTTQFLMPMEYTCKIWLHSQQNVYCFFFSFIFCFIFALEVGCRLQNFVLLFLNFLSRPFPVTTLYVETATSFCKLFHGWSPQRQCSFTSWAFLVVD